MPQDKQMKKKLVFKKGTNTMIIPFLLHDLTPWQDQIREELSKCKSRFQVRKSARWGFEITEYGGQIKCYKL